jgi:Fe2+ transport system protein FeoA
MRCGLCGLEFDEQSAHAACRGCGFAKGCDLVKCPNCGFEDVREPVWLKKLFQRKTNREVDQGVERGNVPLNELEINRKARVSHLETQDRSTLHKLIAIGALPQTEITLIQKFPSYVLQIGRSQYCIDRELASCVMMVDR